MNKEIGTEAAQFLLLGIFVSNFRYCVFAVHATEQELAGSGGMQRHHS
jgi:hypothetical protein